MNKKIRTLVIDDEENNRTNLISLLENYCKEVEIVGQAKNATEGFLMIREKKPDLLFLDIEMPGGSGFDLLEMLGPIDFSVIFATAYDNYAIKAFRFSAVDYLLKPINILELQSAVKKVSDQGLNNSSATKGLANLLENHTQPTNSVKKIALPTADQLIYTPVSEIIRCEGDSNYTHIYLTNGEHILVTRTLKEYDELLSEYDFIRTHQSHLINIHLVKKYIRRDGGVLVMSDDHRVAISRSRKDEVLSALSKL